MVDLKPFPSPAVGQPAHVVHHPRDVFEHALERAWEGQLANVCEAFFHERGSNHGEGFCTVSVRNVLSLEQQEREPKDVIAVDVGDEHGLNRGDVNAVSAQPGQCCGRGIDDVSPIKHRKGVVTPVREEGVARSQHVDAMGHVGRTTCAFLFPSVGVGAGRMRKDTKADIATLDAKNTPQGLR